MLSKNKDGNGISLVYNYNHGKQKADDEGQEGQQRGFGYHEVIKITVSEETIDEARETMAARLEALITQLTVQLNSPEEILSF